MNAPRGAARSTSRRTCRGETKKMSVHGGPGGPPHWGACARLQPGCPPLSAWCYPVPRRLPTRPPRRHCVMGRAGTWPTTSCVRCCCVFCYPSVYLCVYVFVRLYVGLPECPTNRANAHQHHRVERAPHTRLRPSSLFFLLSFSPRAPVDDGDVAFPRRRSALLSDRPGAMHAWPNVGEKAETPVRQRRPTPTQGWVGAPQHWNNSPLREITCGCVGSPRRPTSPRGRQKTETAHAAALCRVVSQRQYTRHGRRTKCTRPPRHQRRSHARKSLIAPMSPASSSDVISSVNRQRRALPVHASTQQCCSSPRITSSSCLDAWRRPRSSVDVPPVLAHLAVREAHAEQAVPHQRSVAGGRREAPTPTA